jgi:ubiquinone/menaquinone biosynthesis C-methylase UbiE
MLPKRLSGYFAAGFLEVVDPRLKGPPHERLASMVRDDEARILEVCAATGFLGRIVATRFPRSRVCALDLSPELIRQGRRRARGVHNLEFVRGDARAIPFPAGSVDVVLAAFGLSELSSAARSQCLREIERVLTRGGRLLVVDIDDPVRDTPFSAPIDSFRAAGVPGRSWAPASPGRSRVAGSQW